MTDMLRFTIDGTPVQAAPGRTILEAALEAGIYIPNLCHHPDLAPVGVCRLCMVDVAGKPVISCKTPAAEGMAVRTETEDIRRVRRTAMLLLLKNHHTDCTTCARNNDCQLQRLAQFVGVTAEDLARLRPPGPKHEPDRSNPFFDRDLDKCVVCGICVRTCNEILGVNAIDYVNRGMATTIGTFGNGPLKDSSCVSCGECVARCPVGALVTKNAPVPAHEVRTVCTYCGCGCGLYLGVRGGRVVSVRGDRDNPANRGNLCVKGRYGYDFIHSADRLTKPLIRTNGTLREASWEEALGLVAEKMAAHRGDRAAVLASAKCTNEDNFVIQKFARAVLDTSNLDHCARL